MKVEIELDPNLVCDLVVKRLQQMYDHTKEHYFDTDPVEARAAIAVVLDYFMAPSEYEEWMATHRNLVDECVEGFDHLEKNREWVRLTKDEVAEICECHYKYRKDLNLMVLNVFGFYEELEAKLKEKNTVEL